MSTIQGFGVKGTPSGPLGVKSGKQSEGAEFGYLMNRALKAVSTPQTRAIKSSLVLGPISPTTLPPLQQIIIDVNCKITGLNLTLDIVKNQVRNGETSINLYGMKDNTGNPVVINSTKPVDLCIYEFWKKNINSMITAGKLILTELQKPEAQVSERIKQLGENYFYMADQSYTLDLPTSFYIPGELITQLDISTDLGVFCLKQYILNDSNLDPMMFANLKSISNIRNTVQADLIRVQNLPISQQNINVYPGATNVGNPNTAPFMARCLMSYENIFNSGVEIMKARNGTLIMNYKVIVDKLNGYCPLLQGILASNAFSGISGINLEQLVTDLKNNHYVSTEYTMESFMEIDYFQVAALRSASDLRLPPTYTSAQRLSIYNILKQNVGLPGVNHPVRCDTYEGFSQIKIHLFGNEVPDIRDGMQRVINRFYYEISNLLDPVQNNLLKAGNMLFDAIKAASPGVWRDKLNTVAQSYHTVIDANQMTITLPDGFGSVNLGSDAGIQTLQRFIDSGVSSVSSVSSRRKFRKF